MAARRARRREDGMRSSTALHRGVAVALAIAFCILTAVAARIVHLWMTAGPVIDLRL